MAVTSWQLDMAHNVLKKKEESLPWIICCNIIRCVRIILQRSYSITNSIVLRIGRHHISAKNAKFSMVQMHTILWKRIELHKLLRITKSKNTTDALPWINRKTHTLYCSNNDPEPNWSKSTIVLALWKKSHHKIRETQGDFFFWIFTFFFWSKDTEKSGGHYLMWHLPWKWVFTDCFWIDSSEYVFKIAVAVIGYSGISVM